MSVWRIPGRADIEVFADNEKNVVLGFDDGKDPCGKAVPIPVDCVDRVCEYLKACKDEILGTDGQTAPKHVKKGVNKGNRG
jgi:hypothetical protein